MNTEIDPKPAAARRPEAFVDTRWSLVAAVQADSKSQRRGSLAALCESYWYPVFAYVRRRGHAPERAYALTQAYFGFLIAELGAANPQEYGRFRSFLLARLDGFLDSGRALETDAAPTVNAPQSLAELEQRQQAELAAAASPERAFQKSFALEVLARSLARLRAEATGGGRAEMFELLEPYLTCEPEPGRHEQLAALLKTRSIAVAMAIKRLRQRFRELVDDELAQTVASGADLDVERSALLAILDQPN